jgi:hypothetical protein
MILRVAGLRFPAACTALANKAEESVVRFYCNLSQAYPARDHLWARWNRLDHGSLVALDAVSGVHSLASRA